VVGNTRDKKKAGTEKEAVEVRLNRAITEVDRSATVAFCLSCLSCLSLLPPTSRDKKKEPVEVHLNRAIMDVDR
jgi:hypothetical protein